MLRSSVRVANLSRTLADKQLELACTVSGGDNRCHSSRDRAQWLLEAEHTKDILSWTLQVPPPLAPSSTVVQANGVSPEDITANKEILDKAARASVGAVEANLGQNRSTRLASAMGLQQADAEVVGAVWRTLRPAVRPRPKTAAGERPAEGRRIGSLVHQKAAEAALKLEQSGGAVQPKPQLTYKQAERMFHERVTAIVLQDRQAFRCLF